MLPEKRKELIIWIVSIICVILAIIIMYNFAKFMRNIGANNNENENVYDDPYPSKYIYYGFIVDNDGNYQFMGLDSEFNETKLGLRTFYIMDNLYYYDNHFVLYNDAINQINYNKEEDVFNFYEQNSFFSNVVDVIITPDYYVFNSNNSIEYCKSIECSEKISITNDLINNEVYSSENKIYYQLADGLYEYDISNNEESLIVENFKNELTFLAINDKYLIFIVGDNYWMYNLSNGISENISEYITLDTKLDFVCLENDSLYLEMVDDAKDNVLVEFSLVNRSISDDAYNIGDEKVVDSYPLNDNLIYAQLFKEDEERYVIMDMEEKLIIKEFENPYVVIRGME